MASGPPEGEECKTHGAAELLTVVVTTSPIPSMPSTALLEGLYKSLSLVESIKECRRILVADGVGEVVSDAGCKPNYKISRVRPDDKAAYDQYLDAIRALIDTQPSLFHGTELVVMPERVGFGLAVKAAVEMATTPFIMVVQHDQLMLRSVDVPAILLAMERFPETLKYVGLPSRTTTVGYADRVMQRYGISIHHAELQMLELPLLPLLMWYDKTHIVSRKHLLEFVYEPSASGITISPGDFTEDILGHRQLADIKENGMDAHSKYGTWVLDEPTPAIYHLSGRRAVSASQSGAQGQQGPMLDAASLAGNNSGTQSFLAVVDGLQRPSSEATQSDCDGSRPEKIAYKFRGLCFNCNQKGHSFKFCPMKHQDSGSSNTS